MIDSNAIPASNCDCIVGDAGLQINGCNFAVECPLADFVKALGPPSRTVEPTPPAPYGHRNNQIHLYDGVGVYLNENHQSHLIGEVCFIFDLRSTVFPVARVYVGRLTVFDEEIRAGKKLSAYPKSWIKLFEPRLPGVLRLRTARFSIYLDSTIRARGQRIRRLDSFTTISVCLPERSESDDGQGS